MKLMIAGMGACWAFAALATVAVREMPKPVNSPAIEHARVEQPIDRVTVPEVRRMKPLAMPSRKGIHWIALTNVAATTPSDGMEDVYKVYYQQRKGEQ